MMQATAAILAGGNSTRMGTDKALLNWDGRPLLAHIAAQLHGWFDHVVLVANQPERYRFANLPAVPDGNPGMGPLGGLEAALRAAQHPYLFLCACDMPFLNEALVRHLVSLAGDPFDAVVPWVGGRAEPLCAVYAASALPAVQALLRSPDRKLHTLLSQLRVRRVEAPEWGRFGPAEQLFFNCNTPADVDAAKQMLRLNERQG